MGNAPETLATTTKPISVPVPQGISEEIVKLVKDRIDFLEAVEAAKCSTWYRQIMEIIQKSKNPPKKSKKTKHQKKNKKENSQDHESIVHGIVDEIISNAIGQGPEQV